MANRGPEPVSSFVAPSQPESKNYGVLDILNYLEVANIRIDTTGINISDDVGVLKVNGKGIGYVQLGPHTRGISAYSSEGYHGLSGPAVEILSNPARADDTWGLFIRQTAPDSADSINDFYSTRGAEIQAETSGVGSLYDIAFIQGIIASGASNLPVGRTANIVEGLRSYASNFGAGHIVDLRSITAYPVATAGTVGKISGVYVADIQISGGATIDEAYALWSADLASKATNSYYFWADSRGVFRIREDSTFNSVGQAIPALYNPQFTKYIAGAANYERIVQQWNTDVAEIGTEKGGTGTLRKIRLIGAGILTNATILPTSNPNVAGQLWNDTGTVKVSAG